jgi:hypothetical protein
VHRIRVGTTDKKGLVEKMGKDVERIEEELVIQY